MGIRVDEGGLVLYRGKADSVCAYGDALRNYELGNMTQLSKQKFSHSGLANDEEMATGCGQGESSRCRIRCTPLCLQLLTAG